MRRVGPAEGYKAGGLAHWCPACEEMHAFALDGPNSSGAQWTWDGNVNAPTFSPSMNIRTNPPGDPHYQPQAMSSVCHYFLRAGVIEYLGDCSHGMKNQKMPLPDLPAHLRGQAMTEFFCKRHQEEATQIDNGIRGMAPLHRCRSCAAEFARAIRAAARPPQGIDQNVITPEWFDWPTFPKARDGHTP